MSLDLLLGSEPETAFEEMPLHDRRFLNVDQL
jgi:hypothetical protein